MRGWKKRLFTDIITAAGVLAVGLTGCGSGVSKNLQDGGAEILAGSGVRASALPFGEPGTVTTLDVSGMFTGRDREIGYEEDQCERIALQGDTVVISAEGCYLLSGEMNGSVIIDADKKDKIRLILDGASITCENGAALYVKQADKVFVTTAADSENLICSKGGFADSDGSKIDGAVFSKDDITFNGAGVLKIVCEAGHGIVCKDDLAITSGSYEITAQGHGLEGKDSVRILSGEILIDATKDGIHSGNDEDETVGYTYIGGGNITIKAGDDGVHSDTQLVIDSGNLTIEKSYEGLEGRSVEIAGGIVLVKADDDGLNAAGGNDGSGMTGRFGGDPFAVDDSAQIIVSGGVLTVHAEGDGLDSNGSLYVRGGAVTVYGPTNGGNGALDYNGDAAITGGTLIALGASQMAQNFGQNSSQPSILVNARSMQAAGTTAELKDAAGRTVLSCTAEKAYNSAVFSCPELETGQSYTAVLGGEAAEVELTSVIYGKGMEMGGFGGGWRPEGGKDGFDGDWRPEGGKDGFDGDWKPEGGKGGFGGDWRPEGGKDGFGGDWRPEGGKDGFDGDWRPEGDRKDFGGPDASGGI